MFLRHIALTLTTTALLAAAPARADTQLSLQFVSPSGSVLATDSIEMWVRLSVTGSDDFTFDLDAGPPWALNALLPTTGNNYALNVTDEPFASYTDINRFTSRNCSGTFSGAPGNACAEVEYTFSSGFGSGSSWFQTSNQFTLASGQSQDFLLYTLVPKAGGAAAGNYELYGVGLGLTVKGLDGAGNLIEADVLAQTCDGQLPGACSFARSVTAVPEPASAALMLAGLGLAAAWARRRGGAGVRH